MEATTTKTIRIDRALDSNEVIQRAIELIKEAWGVNENELRVYELERKAILEKIKSMPFFKNMNIKDVAYSEKVKEYAFIGMDNALYILDEDLTGLYKIDSKETITLDGLKLFDNDFIVDRSYTYKYEHISEYEVGFLAAGYIIKDGQKVGIFTQGIKANGYIEWHKEFYYERCPQLKDMDILEMISRYKISPVLITQRDNKIYIIEENERGDLEIVREIQNENNAYVHVISDKDCHDIYLILYKVHAIPIEETIISPTLGLSYREYKYETEISVAKITPPSLLI